MKKLFLLLVLSILSTNDLNAQSRFIIKGGANYSTFRGEDTCLELGSTIGIGKEWGILQNVVIAGEVLYIIKKATLKDKTVTLYGDFGHAYDIHCNVQYIDVSLLTKCYLGLYKTFKLQLCAGPSLSIGIQDKSTKKRLYSVDQWDDRGRDFDYIAAWDPEPFPAWSSGFTINIGIGIMWSLLTLECRYSRAFYEIREIALICIHEKMDTFNFLISIALL